MTPTNTLGQEVGYQISYSLHYKIHFTNTINRLMAPDLLRGVILNPGSPAIIQPSGLVRSVTLRPCLSTGLPFLAGLLRFDVH
jgi:hypothetical protein